MIFDNQRSIGGKWQNTWAVLWHPRHLTQKSSSWRALHKICPRIRRYSASTICHNPAQSYVAGMALQIFLLTQWVNRTSLNPSGCKMGVVAGWGRAWHSPAIPPVLSKHPRLLEDATHLCYALGTSLLAPELWWKTLSCRHFWSKCQ